MGTSYDPPIKEEIGGGNTLQYEQYFHHELQVFSAMMYDILKKTLPLLVFLMPASAVQAQEIIASWNIRNLGWNNNKDFHALGIIGSHFDMIAVQEVMSEDGIIGFQNSLEAETGIDWDRSCSHLIGRSSYKEMYCFVWRTDTMSLEGGETVYIDSQDVFAREPYSAIFQTGSGFRFKATSIHAIYGNSVAERQREAQALRGYHDWLVESFPGLPIFLMGDFNLAPTNPAWAPVGEIMFPLIQEGGTTLSTIDGRFANLYDNIWVPADQDLPIVAAGRLEFPHQVLGITHEEARARVSDHIPVWMEIDVSAPPARFAPHSPRISTQSGSFQFIAEPSQQAVMPIIGNRNSLIYHMPGCPSYTQVSERNQVHFFSEAEAIEAGFRRARNCE